ncbi:MAG: prepilin-type N-terminal cleavage/methylation domain-containing protein [Phycisphaerales bacterium]|nr:MAG: prepilin-type N-terminal cleavage/methylation domain-containing protein [Phycisphaerales bacterium]
MCDATASLVHDVVRAAEGVCAAAPVRRPRAFTLIEMLVVISILSVLVSLLLPALNAARNAAKTLECSSNMRTVVVDFELFASGDDQSGLGIRSRLGGKRFFINDFQDRLYNLNAFWDLKEEETGMLVSGEEPMLCPAGAPTLSKTRGLPCGREAIEPIRDVSLAINMRLYRAVVDFRGKRILAPVATTHASQRILDHPYVPLVLDVDAKEAVQHGIDPFYIAPGVPNTDDPYSSGRYWFPSKRHGGKTIVGFVGGHVLGSTAPEKERWDWKYQAEVGR